MEAAGVEFQCCDAVVRQNETATTISFGQTTPLYIARKPDLEIKGSAHILVQTQIEAKCAPLAPATTRHRLFHRHYLNQFSSQSVVKSP